MIEPAWSIYIPLRPVTDCVTIAKTPNLSSWTCFRI